MFLGLILLVSGLCYEAVTGVPVRIVGGTDALIDNFPYQVSFYYEDRFSCGGSILSKTHIVTAAHCTDGRTSSSMQIRAGSSYQGLHETVGQLIDVASVMQHPNYNPKSVDFDVSILVLDKPLKYLFKVRPIELSNGNEYVGKKAVVTGWGLIREGEEEAAHQLKQLTVPVHSNAQCKEIYNDEFTDNMICAGEIGGGHDTCMGDSGGPLAFEGKLIGIVSWGYGCAQPGRPGLYSNVPKLYNWITENVQFDE